MKYLSSLLLVVVSLLVSVYAVAERKTAKEIQIVGEETNRISQASAGFALKVLKARDKLAPFAMVLNMDNKITLIEPVVPYIKNAPIKDKINFLRGQVKNLAEKEEIKAAALVSRGFGRGAVDKTKELPGLIVEQEHKRGPSTLQFVPYEVKNGDYVAQQSTSTPKPRLFFNDKISSEETYKKIKQAVQQAEAK